MTGEHPFYVAEIGWLPARELAPGDLLAGVDGELLVEAVRVQLGPRVVFNLTVDDAHTFFVGETGAWVHNKSGAALAKPPVKQWDPNAGRWRDELGRFTKPPTVGTTISQKQNRHIAGRKEYRGGEYLRSAEDAQLVLDAFHSGAAEVLGRSKQGFPIVRVDGIRGDLLRFFDPLIA